MGVTQGPSTISATASLRAIQLTISGLFAGRAYRHHGYRAFRARHDRFVLQDGKGRYLVDTNDPNCVATLFMTLTAPKPAEQDALYVRKREVSRASSRDADLRDWAQRPRPRPRNVTSWRDEVTAA